MELNQRKTNGLGTQQSSPERSTGLPPALSSGGPEAIGRSLGSAGLQAIHHRDNDTNEIRIGALSQHLLFLFTKPPPEMRIRCDVVKRDLPPPVGSIVLVPAGAVADVSWRGKKDCLQICVQPDLVERVAAGSFDRDLSGTSIPPLEPAIVPDLRSAMLAVEVELNAGAAGGPLVIESLANIMTVHLIRHVFGRRRTATRASVALPRRKLAMIVDYIMAKLDGRPTLEEMAAQVHLGPDHFARQFKAATGLAPHQFVIVRRIERARKAARSQLGRSGDICRFLRPKPALFSFQTDRRCHTGTIPRLENRLEIWTGSANKRAVFTNTLGSAPVSVLRKVDAALASASTLTIQLN